jgi:hypothetical protein
LDCYNCRELGHLAHQCPKPKKYKYKKKYKGKKDDSSDDDDEKKKNKPHKKKDGKKKEFHKKKKNGKAYVVVDWLTDIESSSGSSHNESDNETEKVAALVIGSSLSPSPLPPPSPTHLCLMAKGDRKIQNDDDISGDDNASDNENGSDSDEEFESPSYDDLVKLLNQYTKIIRKTRAKNEKPELENDSLLAKYDIAQKASDERREENKIMSSKLKPLKRSLEKNMINLRRYTMSSPLATTC